MKYILITGASGGLGIKLSKYFLDKNYFVIMLYHHVESGVKLLNSSYINSLIYKIDITNEDEVSNLKKYLDKLNIKIDYLINCAAIDHTTPLDEKDENSFINVYKVNVYGSFLMIKYFGDEIDNKSGSILNISSDNTIDSYDIVSLEYDLSKSSLNMLTKEYARYYKNAKVNAIAFSWLDTNMNILDDDMKKYIKFVPFDVACKSVDDMIHSKITGEIKLVR